MQPGGRESSARLCISTETVTSFRQKDGAVTVTTDKGTYQAKQLVVSAGPWCRSSSPPLAATFKGHPSGLTVPRAQRSGPCAIRCGALSRLHLAGAGAAGDLRFPLSAGIEENVRSRPSSTSFEATPQTVDRTASAQEIAACTRPGVGLFFPGLSPVCLKSKDLPYTWVDGARFIIDRHPEHDRIIIASPCSGARQTFAGIGELLCPDGARRDPPRHLDVQVPGK